MDHVRFDYLYPKLPVDISHERFGIDHNRCILCTRCVRVCDQIEGAHTWDVAARGVNAARHHRYASALGNIADLYVVRQVRAGLPHRGHLPQGSTVAEMERDRSMLAFLINAREKKQWNV